jgi:hypothetical protein
MAEVAAAVEVVAAFTVEAVLVEAAVLVASVEARISEAPGLAHRTLG